MRALRFRFDVHRACEVISTRGAEACLAFDPHQERGDVEWFDEQGRGRVFPVADVVRDEPDELRFVSRDGTSYRVIPLSVERYRSRVLPLLGPDWSPWTPSGDTEVDREQLADHLRSLVAP